MSHHEVLDHSFAYDVRDLAFHYGKPARVHTGWALRDVNLAIRMGHVVGIIGPNGSGKTSFLKLLMRILRPQSGEIRLFGRNLSTFSPIEIAQCVALVPQESQLVFPFTLAEFVQMGRFPYHRPFDGLGWDSPEDQRLAWQAMEEMDVMHLAHREMAEVSGGERQRAVIARALVQQPRVLLLDEPTAFLDLNHQLEICMILRRLNAECGLTVMLVSHDLNLASQYCDQLILLKDGQVTCVGMPEEVIRPEILQTVYGCEVLVDPHPTSGRPRVTLPVRHL